jgi:hypothetical protein
LRTECHWANPEHGRGNGEGGGKDMEGSVVGINQKKGMILVDTGDAEYSLLELLGEYGVEVGDFIKDELHSLGGEMVKNLSRDDKMSVFIQDIHMTKAYGLKMLKK